MALLGIITIPSVQQYVVQKAAQTLSETLHTPVTIEKFSLKFFTQLSLQEVLVLDQQRDTLIHIGNLEVNALDVLFDAPPYHIKNITLENADINLLRTRNSDKWNYQYIIDAFESNSTTETKNRSNIELALDKVKLKNVNFNMIDQWVGYDYIVKSGDFEVKINQLDFDKRIINIASISGAQTLFGINDYKGGRPAHLKPKPTPLSDVITPFNPDLWQFRVQNLQLKQSEFFQNDPDIKQYNEAMFNEWKLFVTNINLDIQDIRIEADSIWGHINSLAAQERCGLAIQQMTADVKVSPVISECKNLLLRTNNSTITDYYAMHYNRFPDFLDYIYNVRMEGNFVNAKVGIDDIIYFAPEMKLFEHKVYTLSGKGGGTVDNLYGINLTLKDAHNEIHIPKWTMDALPEIDNSHIYLAPSTFTSNKEGIFLYAPTLAKNSTIDFNNLKSITGSIDFDGSIHDFIAHLKLNTNLGNLSTDMHMTGVMGDAPIYTGAVLFEHLNITALNKEIDIQDISGIGDFNGIGFYGNNWKSTINLGIDNGLFWGQKIDTLLLNTDINPQQIISQYAIHDQKIATTGKLIYQYNKTLNQQPFIQLSGDLAHFDAFALGFPQNIKANTHYEIVQQGDLLDNFNGNVTLNQTNIYRNDKRLNIDSLYVTSTTKDHTRSVNLFTNGLDIGLHGKFDLMYLPNTINYFLHKYIPNYFNAYTQERKIQDFEFSIKNDDNDDALTLLHESLSFPKGLEINGSINNQLNQINIQGTTPFLGWESISGHDINVHLKGNNEVLTYGVNVADVNNYKNNIVSNLLISGNLTQNFSNINVHTQTLDTFGSASLNAHIDFEKEVINAFILPSQITLNNHVWDIKDGNQIRFWNNKLSINKFSLKSENQSILINKIFSDDELEDDFKIEFNNINIAPLTRFLAIDQLITKASVDGIVEVNNIFTKPMIDFDLSSTNFHLSNSPYGLMQLKGNLDVDKSVISFEKPSGLYYKNDQFAQFYGKLSLAKSSNNALATSVVLNNAPIIWAHPFISEYTDSLSGSVSGTVKITGNILYPITNGQVQLHNLGARPIITGVKYTLQDTIIPIINNQFLFNDIKVFDVEQNIALLNGKIFHNKYDDFRFDLRVTSPKIKVVSLQPASDLYFYGNVYSNINARLTGPFNDIQMNVLVTTLKPSHLFIKMQDDNNVGQYSFIRFKRKEGSKSNTPSRPGIYSYNLKLDAVINNNLDATIIIDESTGEVLNAKGSGNLTLEIPSNSNMKLNGTYTIDEGNYNFAFQQLQILNYKRNFQIARNSLIKWDGDIYNALLNITASTTVNTRLYDLVSDEANKQTLPSSEIRDAQINQPVKISLDMKGFLSKPEFDFNIDLIENRSIGTYAYQKLQRINNDSKLLLNQVASLLLLEQFTPPEGLGGNNALLSSGTINNMSDLFTSVASSQITNFASKLTGLNDLQVGLGYKNYNLYNNNYIRNDYLNRNEASVNVRKNFFNNRLIVQVGGVYDWGTSASSNKNLAGDFNVQYLLNDEGKIRLNIFSNTSYDAIYQQNITRQGVGISFRRSFNKFRDFFHRDSLKIPTIIQHIDSAAAEK